jgi:hypothetical protein
MVDEVTKFDLRVLERKLKNGEIKESEYKKFLESLDEGEAFVEIDEETLLKDAGVKKKEKQ